MERSLKTALERAVGEAERGPENRFEARRHARQAADAATAVLRSEGYYGAIVEPDVTERDPPQAVIRVRPGPRFVIAEPMVEWVGASPDPDAERAAMGAVQLKPGDPGKAADVIGAEGRIVATVQKHGYADVVAEPREVIVDHADNTVRPTFRISAGPLVKLDGVTLVTDGRTRLGWVRTLAPWRSGDTYDPDKVGELERRLLDAGIYESVTVGLAAADQSNREGLRPVLVSLAERRRRTLDTSASYSTSDGAGIEVKWTRYNLLGRADTSSVVARASERDSRAGVELSLPHWRRAQQTLRLAASGYRIRTDAYDETGAGIRGDITRRRSLTSYVTLGASLDASRTNEIVDRSGLAALGRDILTLAGLADVALDRSDNPLDPTRGWRLSGRGEPTLLIGDENLPYLRLQAQGSIYYSLDRSAKTVLAARLRFGSIINGSIPQIPASRRFYAGGGGSVRGFAFQGVGPRLSNGKPLGGLSLVEGSFEVRRDLFGPWGVAAFVDAGSVSSRVYPGLGNMAVGAGLGVRYNLPFAPIRADIAAPVSRRRSGGGYQIYLSIGQAF